MAKSTKGAFKRELRAQEGVDPVFGRRQRSKTPGRASSKGVVQAELRRNQKPRSKTPGRSSKGAMRGVWSSGKERDFNLTAPGASPPGVDAVDRPAEPGKRGRSRKARLEEADRAARKSTQAGKVALASSVDITGKPYELKSSTAGAFKAEVASQGAGVDVLGRKKKSGVHGRRSSGAFLRETAAKGSGVDIHGRQKASEKPAATGAFRREIIAQGKDVNPVTGEPMAARVPPKATSGAFKRETVQSGGVANPVTWG